MPKGVTKVAFINKTFPEGNYILELTITYGENSFLEMLFQHIGTSAYQP